ncbi:recombinase family protein [Candidatus Gottesmanbacteria bacterium]|nr:recombinase family protein [Candidatus Gottesmanbacteria bacterium]
MIKYIAYCRKSTDEPDRQILSIEAQVAELEEFASKENLKIVSFVTESKTAKEPGREKFANVLEIIENGQAAGIISWHPDRLARNSIDGGKIIYLLDTGKILDLKFPSFWFENTPQGKFMLSIAFGQSKYYVDNLSENVKRGNRQKLRRGEWPNQAPFGYLNINKKIEVDKKRAKYVQKAFQLFATGGYGYADIRKFFNENKIFNKSGHELHLDKIKRFLTDPFYYGVMRFCGELYEGKHQPLISKKLFDNCQEVVKLKSRKVKNNKHLFNFLGLVKCGECGGAITAEKHTKYYRRTNRKVEYVYYRCSKKKGKCLQKYIDKEEIEKQLRKIVLRASLPPYASKKFLEWAEKDANEEKQKSSGIVSDYQLRLKEAEEKQDRLLEGYLDKVITSEDYQKKKNELVETKSLLNSKIKEISQNGVEWLEPFQEFVNSALSAHKIARAKNSCHDLSIMAKTVGSNFFLLNRRLSASFKKDGFDALAAEAGAASATSQRLSSSYWLPSLDSNED